MHHVRCGTKTPGKYRKLEELQNYERPTQQTDSSSEFSAFVPMNCQRNQPVYPTFHLYNQLNISKVMNYKEWEGLKPLWSNFTVGQNGLQILGPSLQLNLQMLSSITTANFTSLRLQLSAPVTKRDLNSFADQLNTVAGQLTDPVSSRKIDNLSFAVRKVAHNEVQKLSEIRNGILYKITALEMMLPPLNRETNQSLSHLRTIQYFLDHRGWQIAERKITWEELYNHVNTKVTKEVGKCRPLWEIFHSARFYVCKLIVDPLLQFVPNLIKCENDHFPGNGMAFSCFFLILLFLLIAPVVLKLVEFYRENNEDLLASITHRRTSDGQVIDDQGTWATPYAESPLEGRLRKKCLYLRHQRTPALLCG
ncbi:hypothetical protein NQ318_011331 [Aromia moschata]|uniref:Uncharacterized protein n=1 Tax=Aromia moschata TaxID=1265417 RepID=A0AAV8XLY4_9CUCU|nr:hypothetical protein NQ318_011331 [Aromia moschata]